MIGAIASSRQWQWSVRRQVVTLAIVVLALLLVARPASGQSSQTFWCLAPENLERVASAAEVLGFAQQRGQNVKVGERILSLDQWRKEFKDEFDEACRRAYDASGGDVVQVSVDDPDDPGGGEDELVALAAALVGALAGGAATHVSSSRRDRRISQRQDRQTFQRLASEVRFWGTLCTTTDSNAPAGVQARASLRLAASQLDAILDDPALGKDRNAAETLSLLRELLTILDEETVDLTRLSTLTHHAPDRISPNAGTWARQLNDD